MAVTKGDLQKILSEAPFLKEYGFRLHSVADGMCQLRVPFRNTFERPGGIISGPVFMAAADVAMWLAIMTRLGKDDPSVTIDMKTAFLSWASQEEFRCTARLLRMGKRLIYGIAECVDKRGKLLTHHTITYIRPDR
ncbi:MAG: PaaI family thioesterase [Candidatus Deferrimicrobiaceae bacterium]